MWDLYITGFTISNYHSIKMSYRIPWASTMGIFTTDAFEPNLKYKDQVWCTPKLPTLRRMEQDSEFQASLGAT